MQAQQKQSRPRGRRKAPKLPGWRNIQQVFDSLNGSYTKYRIRKWVAAGHFDDPVNPPKNIGGVWYVSAKAAKRRKGEVTL